MPKGPKLVTIIHPGDVPDTVTTEADPDLKRLQGIVGGYIQLLPGFNKYNGRKVIWAYCNEEGRLEELPFNQKASQAWARCFRIGTVDYDRAMLFGEIVIIQSVPEV